MSSEIAGVAREQTWKPTTAGVLTIISGVVYFLCLFCLLIAGFITGALPEVPNWVSKLLYGLSIPTVILGVLAITGGVFAMKRRAWGMALTGAIAAFIISFVFGLCAIIFLAMSKREFV
jgi:hypothetical protein